MPSILDEKNFFKTQWKWCYFVQKKISNKSPKSVWVYLVPRYAAKFLKNIFLLFFNTIGIRKYSRNAHAISFLAYFVPNFLLIIFLKTKKIYLVPPTQKLAKTVENSTKIAHCLGSNFSRLGPKSKKPYSQTLQFFLVILKRLSAWFYLLWGFQKSAHCETQYFDINVRGRGSNFFSPNFLDVFLNVESDKKNR